MSELLKCPFCGGHGIMHDRYVNGMANTKAYWIVCGKCETKQHERRSAKRAIEAWNRRADNGTK